MLQFVGTHTSVVAFDSSRFAIKEAGMFVQLNPPLPVTVEDKGAGYATRPRKLVVPCRIDRDSKNFDRLVGNPYPLASLGSSRQTQ